jgi:hypothetical protein
MRQKQQKFIFFQSDNLPRFVAAADDEDLENDDPDQSLPALEYGGICEVEHRQHILQEIRKYCVNFSRREFMVTLLMKIERTKTNTKRG